MRLFQLFSLFITVAISILALTPKEAIAAPAKSVLETLKASGNFDTLVDLVAVAGLSDTFEEIKGMTLFAPTDKVFSDMPEGVVEEFKLPERKPDLVRLLKSHLVIGTHTTDTLAKYDELESLEGLFLEYERSEQTWINEAAIVDADIEAENGVIHSIDRLILPRDFAY